ncbi:MAG: hypothetical protein JWO95_288 [Verrucomicrobiales bacterium]|nr:hypothetical protein [Verrucomicrobiales bacterium]
MASERALLSPCRSHWVATTNKFHVYANNTSRQLSEGSQPVGGWNKNRRILIVDDNEAIHQDFRKIVNVDSNENDFDAAEAAVLADLRAIRKQRAHFERILQFMARRLDVHRSLA